MKLLDLASRLLVVSGLQMIAAITASVATHDAWLVASLVAGVASGVIAAIAVFLLMVVGFRHVAANRPAPPLIKESIMPHERGQTGLGEPEENPQPRRGGD